MEEIQIVLSLIPQENWEFIDFISYNSKIEKLKKFASDKLSELAEALTTEEKNLGYVQRTLMKIVDNIHVNIKNVHIRIEEPNKSPFYSLGFTLQEMMVINTNEKWEEIFIDRNKYKDLNVYKLLKIKNFGFYLKHLENDLFSNISNQINLKKKVSESFALNDPFGRDFEYLIKPISLVCKLKQNNQNLSLLETPSTEIDIKTPIEGISKINISINLNKFDIDFQKHQFDTIIRIMNHTSNYQKFQYFFYESRKIKFFKPKNPIKINPRIWWRYSITSVIKRLRYLRGNEREYDRVDYIMKYYEDKFSELHYKYLKDPQSLTSEENSTFVNIITNVEENLLYQWSIKGIKQYFTLTKKEENKKNKTSLMGKLFGTKITEENLLSKEEIMKIEEIVESSTKQLKNELILTSKEVKLKVEFLLDEGSFVFSKQNKDIVESFSFKYKKLYFNMKKGENFNELEAYLKDFVIDMITTYKNNEVKTSQITYHDKDKILVNKNDMIVNIDEDYVWKLEFLIFGPGEKINSDLNLHIVIKFLFFLNIF